MAAYYNEIDPNAAEWLRQLIKLGAIAPGDVDTRDIRDVVPDDLRPYTQCHFFAGIGVWSYALRQAGWDDDRPIWTGSPPCQPFSAAGKRKGADDDRDLWWAMFWHICQLRPETIIGEQVSSKDGLAWWDTVAADLEGANYAATAFDLPAAGIGAPHIRQRLYWVGHSSSEGLQERQCNGRTSPETGSGDAGAPIERAGLSPGGFWDDAIWLPCKDGKLRPAKRGTFPLAHGSTPDLVCSGDSGIAPHQAIQTEATAEARAMRLKGYGNAIVAPLAIEFIQALTLPRLKTGALRLHS